MLTVSGQDFLRITQVPKLSRSVFTSTEKHVSIRRYIDSIDRLGMAFQSGGIVSFSDIPKFDVCIIASTR